MSDQVVNRTVNVFINTGEAQKAYDKLITKEKSLQDSLKATSDPKRIQQLNRELEKLQEPIGRASKKLSGELGPSLKDMQKLVRDLGNRLYHMSNEDADFSAVLAQYRQAQVELRAMRTNVAEVSNALEQTKTTNPFGRVLEYAKGTLLGGAVQKIIEQFANFFGDAIDEALSAEEGTARFAATLDNLGRNDAFDRIIAKADELAAKFRYLDNDDIVGVFNKLIDYGKLTERQMNDLLPVIINFAAKQRISIDESASVIIKALEGNGKALKEYGITLNSTASTADNLQVIMGTLANKVEGAGEAFLENTAGGAAATKQEFANLKEEIGTGLLPALNSLMSGLNKVLTGLKYIKSELIDVAAQDFKALFTGGFSAVDANIAAREKAKQDNINDTAAGNLVKTFQDNIGAELKGIDPKQAKQYEQALIQEEIIKVQNAIAFRNKQLKGLPRLIQEGAADQAEVARVEKALAVSNKQLEKLQAMANAQLDTVLGDGGDDQAEKAAAAKEAAEKKKREQEKALQEYRALMKTLRDLQNDLSMNNMDEKQKEFFQMELKYAELRKQAAGHADALLKIQQLYHQEADQLTLKWARKEFEEEAKWLEEREKAQTDFFERTAKKAEAAAARLSAVLANGQKRAQADAIAGLQLDILREGKNPFSTNRLQLQKKLLDMEKQQELQNKELTENQKLLIEEQYREKKKQAEMDYWNNMVSVVLSFTQQALQVLQQFSQNKTDQENRELERDRKVNDRKRDNLKKQLDGKRITQMDYDRQMAEMDKKQEAKEKQVRMAQFRRQQRLAVVNAIINGAQGVQKSLAEWGMPFAIPWIALTVASTAAQIAAINKQQPPEFARGGLLNGPSHNSRSKGMPVTNPVTGQVQALMEGGEAITNKRTIADGNSYTVSGTPSQIISRLNALHGGVSWSTGATLFPAWRAIAPQRMNFSALNNSMRTVRMYETGGLFSTSASTSNSTAVSGADLTILLQLASVVEKLNTTLDGGIQAPVLLSDIQRAEARKQAILNEATLK
jgi:hypothetical protein